MLTIRRRGKNGYYYIRGSVTLGDKTIVVKEFSIGTSDADAASHLMAEYETDLRTCQHETHAFLRRIAGLGMLVFTDHLDREHEPAQ